MIEIEKKEECCGCEACYNVCPHKAIKMSEDENGFKFSNVLKEKCTNCNACLRVCPILNTKNIDNKLDFEKKAFIAINRNEEIRKVSSSGGIFTLLAEEVLKDGGVVFGAMFDDKFNVVHGWIEDINDICKMRGSKYVQSEIKDSYNNVKKFLEQGRKVLFTGTPCQVSGLINFLGKQYPNLYTQDIICHGVPSPKVWRKYIQYRRKKDKSSPASISFRDKKHGWKLFSMKFAYENMEYVQDINHDIYLKAFLRNIALRDSCYSCRFKDSSKVSADITLGDFWGIEQVAPEFNDNKGVSAVILNTEKGLGIFKEISSNIIKKEIDIDTIVKYNSALTKSVSPSKNREKFFADLDKKDFDELASKYLKEPSVFRKIASKIKRSLLKNENYVNHLLLFLCCATIVNVP